MTNSEGEKFIADKSSFQLFFSGELALLFWTFETCENKWAIRIWHKRLEQLYSLVTGFVIFSHF